MIYHGITIYTILNPSPQNILFHHEIKLSVKLELPSLSNDLVRFINLGANGIYTETKIYKILTSLPDRNTEIDLRIVLSILELELY